ncbi:MAG: metallophosphoesterase [Nanoarchaeota archaeon]
MDSLKIFPGAVIVGLGLYLKEYKTLVIADIHIGFEDSLIARGVLVPKFQERATLAKLKDVLDSCPGPISRVILNGDVKHEFARASSPEWSGALKVIDLLMSKGHSVTIIKGNHDTMIGPIAKKRDIEVVKEARIGRFLVTHGDSIPSVAGVDCVIIGHEHPAIGLREGARVERYKCFLKGRFKSKTLIVMPSFLPATEGTDLISSVRLSPFLKGDISDFEVFIVEERVYRFGRLSKVAALK